MAAIATVGLATAATASAAGTYTWDLNSDFTATAPGANPDHDKHGGTPWSYEKGSATPLPSFDTGIDNGLAGWHDTGDLPLAAINPTNADITNGGSTYTAGQVVLQPSLSNSAVVAWTSPVTGTVSVTGSFNPDTAVGPLCPNSTWELHNNGGLPLDAGTSGSISDSVSVQAGDRITLEAVLAPVPLSADCAASSVAFTISIPSTVPTVTLDTPADNSTITTGHPTFTGTGSTGFGISNTVKVKIYAGGSATGSPIETLNAPLSGTSYSVSPSPDLADGTYTAQAEQSDLAGDTGQSQPTTFTLSHPTPSVTLDSLGSTPLTTATPSFAGSAAPSTHLTLAIFSGASASGAPVESVGGTSGPDGRFSIAASPPLADGQYTAVASVSSVTQSQAVTFRIKVHPPALSVTSPAAGGRESVAQPEFAGGGGGALGDSNQVRLTLFSGAGTGGRLIGATQATVAQGAWSLRWPQRLALGTYTLQASQGDDAGRTTTVTRSFVIVPAPNVIGSSVSVSRAGFASVPIGCQAPSGHLCTGDVLVLTVKSYRTVNGGPAGKIRVMFAYVRIPGGTTQVIKRRVGPDALRALRHLRGVRAKVITTLKDSGGATTTVSAQRSIRLAGR